MNNEQLRKEFEAWGNAQNTSGNTDRFKRKGDGYVFATADIMWKAYQAAAKSRDELIATLQTLLNQAAEALSKIRGFEEDDWDSENPHYYAALFEEYVETREIAKQALAAIQPYLTTKGE